MQSINQPWRTNIFCESQWCLCCDSVYCLDYIRVSACMTRCYTEPLTRSATLVRSTQLEAITFCQPITSRILYLLSVLGVKHVQTQFKFIAPSITMKTWLYSASATKNNRSFLLVFIRCVCNRPKHLHNNCCIPHAPANIPHKILIKIYFHIWTQYKPIIRRN